MTSICKAKSWVKQSFTNGFPRREVENFTTASPAQVNLCKNVRTQCSFLQRFTGGRGRSVVVLPHPHTIPFPSRMLYSCINHTSTPSYVSFLRLLMHSFSTSYPHLFPHHRQPPRYIAAPQVIPLRNVEMVHFFLF